MHYEMIRMHVIIVQYKCEFHAKFYYGRCHVDKRSKSHDRYLLTLLKDDTREIEWQKCDITCQANIRKSLSF